MRGGYVLLIEVPRTLTLHLKSLGKIILNPGCWIYTGSAMGKSSTSLENRIRRHFRSEKRLFWHIDYLLATEAKLKAAIWARSDRPIECSISEILEEHQDFVTGPKGFGSSDCKQGCVSHLYQAEKEKSVTKAMIDIFQKLKLEPNITYNGEISVIPM